MVLYMYQERFLKIYWQSSSCRAAACSSLACIASHQVDHWLGLHNKQKWGEKWLEGYRKDKLLPKY